MYFVHTDLDSFILCNDESIDNPKDINANNRVEPIDFNIMSTLDIEENEEETFGQCIESKTQSKQNQDYEYLNGHLSELHTHHEEKNTPHHDADPILQHNNETNVREENDDKPENDPLWRMNFDGSCTRKNAGAGLWLHNTESDYAESHALKLDFKCTNNIAEYEALILGLNLLKKLGARRIPVHGESELIIK